MTTTKLNRGRSAKRTAGSQQRSVMGQHVNIWNSGPEALEKKHGYTKHGHGRHYLSIGEPYSREYVDKAWDRRCDASRWAKRAGAKTIKHWWLF